MKFLSRSGAIGRTRLGTALFGIALVAGVGSDVMAAAQSPASQAPPAAARAKKYRATSPIVRDQATGQRRMPTDAEVTQLVANLSTLTQRSESLPEASGAVGGVSIDLAGGYNGVVLAKANEDGSFETLCVFTFDEGVAFLGLEPVIE
jgi:hypothetical protein